MLSTALVICVCLNVALGGTAPTIVLNDGNKIPIVALGTGRGTSSKAPLEDVRHAVLWAIEAGYRHVDTAAIYMDEEQVGQGIADAIGKGLVKREDLFVTTKLWCDRHARSQVVPALKESLQRLGLDYVDLYLIHFPAAFNATDDEVSMETIDYLETWHGMEDAKELGLTKSIGVSNFNSSQIDRIIANSKVKPAVNEIEVNPTLTQEALVDHCRSLDIAVMAYSPFGFLVSRNSDMDPPPKADDPVLTRIGQKYGKSSAQIVLRYLIDRGLIPIPKSTNQERIAQNIDLFDFKLTADEVQEISKFNKNIRVIKFDRVANHPYYPFYPY